MLAKCGVRVPEDISVVGLSVPGQGRRNPHGLAGIDEQLDRVGAAAVNMVAAQLHLGRYAGSHGKRYLLIEGRWRDGQTLFQLVESSA
ncbi:MAG: substrate-binding domain-containing protein [Verrucomicrobiales bacterium]